jgi:hypothetical protein
MIAERTRLGCGREFQPSSRHLRCPSCRSKSACPCGQLKQAKSDQRQDIRALHQATTSSSTSWCLRKSSAATCTPTSGYITATASAMTTDPRISSCGRALSQQGSASATPLPGRARSSHATRVPVHLQQCSRHPTGPEHSWRWGESNPRPSAAHQGFSGRSLLQFSQPQRSRRQVAAGSVTVWFPCRPRDRVDR